MKDSVCGINPVVGCVLLCGLTLTRRMHPLKSDQNE